MNLTVPQAPERSGPITLSAAKDLARWAGRSFAALRMTDRKGQDPDTQTDRGDEILRCAQDDKVVLPA